MAQRVHVLLTDDLDGTEASQTVKFGWLGADYEVDLNEKNYAAFEKVVGKYVAVARKTGGGARAKAAKKSAVSAVDLTSVRAWARENGYEVSERGRVSGVILDAYKAAAS